MPLFEMVPNLSEGRNHDTIAAAAAAARSARMHVLHTTSDRVHHRSVLTLAGTAKCALDAALAIASVACERIDLRRHHGAHPRIGALDVLPFVPLNDASMSEAVALAHDAGQRIWERLRIPSFFYGEAATRPQRTLLADVRAGGFEGLVARFEDPAWHPDVGDVARHESAGAIAIGARPLLVAFNIVLETGDLRVARHIAARLRERNGGLMTLRALGFALDDATTQVSFNVTSHQATPLYRVVELVRTLAAQHGVRLRTCELIGCIPQCAVESAARYYLGVPAQESEPLNS
jgi:glutamate formiminotransferase